MDSAAELKAFTVKVPMAEAVEIVTVRKTLRKPRKLTPYASHFQKLCPEVKERLCPGQSVLKLWRALTDEQKASYDKDRIRGLAVGSRGPEVMRAPLFRRSTVEIWLCFVSCLFVYFVQASGMLHRSYLRLEAGLLVNSLSSMVPRPRDRQCR